MSQDALQIKTRKEGSGEAGDIVFLCHNSADKAFIRKLADALELEFGTKFFLDVFAIPTGEAFISWIEKALETCTACAIFLGGNGWGPTHLWEAELALARYRRDPTLRIIPVALPGLSQQDAAKLGAGKLFQEVNWADFTKGPNDKDSLDKLEAALTGRKVLGYRGPARLTPYQVRRDAERWERSGRKDRSILYGGRQLIDAARMLQDNPDAVVVADVASFLAASRERQSTFWRRAAIAASAAVVLLLAASAVAITSYVLAEQRRLGSVSRQLAMAARDTAGADRGLLIAARAVLVDATPEARGALLEQLQEFSFLRRVVDVGSYVEAATLGADGAIVLGTAAGTRRLSRDDVSPASSDQGAPSSRESVTAVLEGEGSIWLGREDGRVDVVTGGKIRTLLAARDVSNGRERKVRSLAYDSAKRLLAMGTGSGRIAVVRLSDDVVVSDINEGEGKRINALSFDSTRPRLAIGTSDGMIALMDTRAMLIDLRYPRLAGGVLALGYTKDGSLATVGGEGRLFFFDRRNPELESPTTGDAVPLATAAAIDPATSRVAIGDSSGTVRLYDAASGQGTGAEPLRGHSDSVTTIAFGPGRDDLTSASSNGTVAVWDLAGRQGPGEELPQFNPSPSVLRVDSEGMPLGALRDENRGELRRLEAGEWKSFLDLIAVTREAGDESTFFAKPKKTADGFVELLTQIPAIALSDDGGRVAWSTSGGAILSLAAKGPPGKATILSAAGKTPPDDIAISGDGRTLAAIEEGGGRVSVYETGSVSNASSIVPPASARSVALSRDGSLLAIGMKDGRLIQYLKASNWSSEGEPWPVHNSEVAGVVYSADAKLIVSFGSGGGGTDRAVAFSHAHGNPDPRRLQSRQASKSVSSISAGSRGGIVAAGDQDGRVLQWSASEARYFGRITAGTTAISALLVDEKGGRLLTASGDGSVRSWALDSARWVSLACAKANRGFRRDEWRELLPDDAYVATCSAAHPRGILSLAGG
ncbi:TIR domain-containing protein [Bradyrhizobium sp. th.b2]|uniref:toll/interleukin-1 receptor domain-containing protein n=1 Tax=Bradyrhizobium sp. th-b2 TaxID=172088 RepID=UPI00041D19B7|nr:TIR domain-containing protein [Bradyrhizobium sp. th.b2]